MQTYYYYIVYGWIAIAIISFPYLLKKVAPYGRHSSSKWGWMIPNKLGWVLMELVSPVVFSIFFFSGSLQLSLTSYCFWFLWMLHYFNRSVVFPLRTKTAGKKMPAMIALSASFFNIINGFVNGYFFGNIGGNYGNEFFTSPQFIIGLMVFAIGAFINIKSDNILLALRKPNETGYKIPQGFLFKYISCPNLFGEIIEWFGFALLTWSLPALSFAVWTAANLTPRAIHHHKWYKEKFADYPKERKALLPGLM